MTTDTLHITLIQSQLHWEDPAANRAMFQQKIDAITEKTHLIVLPEMFTTGFTMNAASLAEPANNSTTLRWMQQIASNKNCALTGSVIIEEDGAFYNRLLFVRPDGTVQQYDKKHTFTLAGEHKTYAAGNEKIIIEYLGWNICPLICYDLRFPVWARNLEDYDLLLFVANWPDKRVAAWDALLKARAIENMSYCVGLNRVGPDGNNHMYSGHSAVYDVLGEPLSDTTIETEFTNTFSLSKSHIAKNREHLQFLKDRDAFSLTETLQ